MRLPLSVLIVVACVSSSVVHGQQVHDVGNGVTAPRAVKTAMPTRALDTDVVVRCVVTGDGAVRDAAVVRDGNPADDLAVLDAVAQWQFEPATKDGEPVAVRFYIQFHRRAQR